jgi:hypothetical protein
MFELRTSTVLTGGLDDTPWILFAFNRRSHSSGAAPPIVTLCLAAALLNTVAAPGTISDEYVGYRRAYRR